MVNNLKLGNSISEKEVPLNIEIGKNLKSSVEILDQDSLLSNVFDYI